MAAFRARNLRAGAGAGAGVGVAATGAGGGEVGMKTASRVGPASVDSMGPPRGNGGSVCRLDVAEEWVCVCRRRLEEPIEDFEYAARNKVGPYGFAAGMMRERSDATGTARQRRDGMAGVAGVGRVDRGGGGGAEAV